MPIPQLNQHGLLPEGIHDCSLDEMGKHFGGFQSTDQRPRLWRRFQQFVEELRRAGVARELLVNGSFVTSKPDPNDIDLILVLPLNHDFHAPLIPRDYNVLSKRSVRSRFGFYMFVVRAESIEYRKAVEFFAQVRDQPRRQKGILRLTL